MLAGRCTPLAGARLCAAPAPRRARSRAVRVSAVSDAGGIATLLRKATSRKTSAPPPPPPAGTPADATALKAAGAALAIPALPAFVATEPVLDAFGVTHSDPSAFAAVEDIGHYSNVIGSDCFVLVALCALVVLADAAENNRLDSATYQRLAVALVLYGGSVTLGVLAAFGVGFAAPDLAPAPSPAAVAAVAAAFSPAAAVGASVVSKYGDGLEGAIARAKEDVRVVLDVGGASERGGYLERYYKLSFWASMIVGGAFAFSPLSPLALVNEYDASAQFLQRAFGLGTVFMLAPAQFVLLDAASRGRLGGGTFKKLNLSIAACIAGIDSMTIYTFGAAKALGPDADALASASGGVYNYVGALAVSFSILAVYLYQGVFAKK